MAIHQCARSCSNPRASHGEALKRIGRYLQGTINHGIILNPNKTLNLDLFPDADFAGLWGNEHPDDPSSVRSRSGFVITLGGCPVKWSSKLQTEIAVSTMEAEYISASTGMRTLVPLRNRLINVCSWLELSSPDTAIVSTVWEDNNAAMYLATSDPPRLTPRSKHIAIKYHWFRSHLKAGQIEMRHIESQQQLADILTKPLTFENFQRARKLLLGW
jgi:histone deacetylase 1/2